MVRFVHEGIGVQSRVTHNSVYEVVHDGSDAIDATKSVETDRAFWGVKNKIRQLDSRIQSYCSRNGLAFSAFVGSPLYLRWENDVYKHRNAAVHAGANAFTYGQAHTAIGTAKECNWILSANAGTGDSIATMQILQWSDSDRIQAR